VDAGSSAAHSAVAKTATRERRKLFMKSLSSRGRSAVLGCTALAFLGCTRNTVRQPLAEGSEKPADPAPESMGDGRGCRTEGRIETIDVERLAVRRTGRAGCATIVRRDAGVHRVAKVGRDGVGSVEEP
jgi:hypothetical protein